MNHLLMLPIVIPMATAIVLLAMRRSLRVQAVLGVAGALALFAAALLLFAQVWNDDDGILTLSIGAWPAPYGIVFVADLLSATMVAVTGLMGLAVAVYSLAAIDERRQRFAYFPLFHILLMGVCGAFLTGDLFNLFVWFEVMLIASFVLMALGGTRGQLEGALKYVTLNLLASAFFLAGVGLLYGLTGTLNMADLAVEVAKRSPAATTPVALVFLVAFGIKAAIFPLFFWLPASYHTPPVAVGAIFAGLLTKVGVYALIRVFTLIFVADVAFTHQLILIIAGLTMLTGVLGAAAQNDFRRILSFHIVSQIGYMIMGLGLYSPLALAGSVFYIVHHIIVKTNLFLVAGAVRWLGGGYRLEQLGGFYRRRPLVAFLFTIPAFSLAGIPPLSGFWAKLVLIKAGIELEQFVIVAVALVVGMMTLFSMTKIWAGVFWTDEPAVPVASDADLAERRLSPAMLLPIVALAGCTVTIGVLIQPVFELASRTAEQLMTPSVYISAVLVETE